MNLKELLQLSQSKQFKKQGLSEQRLLANIDGLRNIISFFREYPDIFVDFVQMHSGAIPRYECDQPQDLIDKIIDDLKAYNKSLIYEDQSLAREIEKYLQDKRIAEEMRNDKKVAKEFGLQAPELSDEDHIAFQQSINEMKQQDQKRYEEGVAEE